jgi:hypothetical protein
MGGAEADTEGTNTMATSYEAVASDGRTHRPWPEALRDALLAVAAGGIWSLVIGFATGSPLQTWTRLGTAIAGIAGPGAPPSPFVAVVCVLALMILIFTVVSRIAIAIAHGADRTPGLILLWVLLTSLFLLASVAVTTAFNDSRLGSGTWLQTLGSAVVAVITLTTRIVRMHPALPADFERMDEE